MVELFAEFGASRIKIRVALCQDNSTLSSQVQIMTIQRIEDNVKEIKSLV